MACLKVMLPSIKQAWHIFNTDGCDKNLYKHETRIRKKRKVNMHDNSVRDQHNKYRSMTAL